MFVYLRIQNRQHAIPAPVTIGRSSYADIVVNSDATAPVQYVVAVKDGLPVVTDVQRATDVSCGALRSYRIVIQGAGRRNKGWHRIFGVERFWAQKFFRSRWLKPLQWRAVRWSCLSASVVMAISFWGTTQESGGDRMAERALPLDQVVPGTIGRSPSRHGAELGVRYLTEGDSEAQQFLLRWTMGGIRSARDMQILADQKIVYQVPLRERCVEEMCSYEVRINGSLPDSISFSYDGEGIYLIKDVYFGQMLPLTSREETAFRKLMDSAQRHYQERDILSDNLLKAHLTMLKVDELVSNRMLPTTTLLEVRDLGERIRMEYEEVLSQIWSEVERLISLGEYEKALQELDDIEELSGSDTAVLQRVKAFRNHMERLVL